MSQFMPQKYSLERRSTPLGVFEDDGPQEDLVLHTQLLLSEAFWLLGYAEQTGRKELPHVRAVLEDARRVLGSK